MHNRIIRAVGVSLAGVFAMVFALLPYTPSHASNDRVITIHYDGIEQTVVTDAPSVQEVLKRANIGVDKADLVEPALNTQLSAPSYSVNIYRARPVTVVDGDVRSTVVTPHTSAAKIAEAAKLSLYPEDLTELTRTNDFLVDGAGLKLTIRRATPLTMVLYGKQQDVRTQAKTVAELMTEKAITLGANDGTSIPTTTPITLGMRLEFWRNGVQTITEEQAIAFSTEFIRDTDQPVGFKQIQTAGVAGKKMVTYEVTLRNGQELDRKEIQSVVVQQPSKQVEVIGVQLGFSGAFQDALARLRGCEAGGRYDRNSGNGYFGAYQFDIGTWGGYMGYARADLAPPEVQDKKTYETYLRRGWSPWPGCTKKLNLQDVYR